MPIQEAYTTGTATVTAGSDIVDGINTTWALSAVNGGLFMSLGLSVSIAEVISDTRLRLVQPWPGATGSGAYSIDLGRADAASAIVASRRLAELIAGLSGMSALGSQLTAADTAAAMRIVLGLPTLFDAKLDKTAARHWFLYNCAGNISAGQTRFLCANRIGAGAPEVYIAVPQAGWFRQMRVVTQGSPGSSPSAKWTFTLQNLFSDTAMTVVIPSGRNQGASETPVQFNADARFCVKAAADPANNSATGDVLISLEFEPDA